MKQYRNRIKHAKKQLRLDLSKITNYGKFCYIKIIDTALKNFLKNTIKSKPCDISDTILFAIRDISRLFNDSTENTDCGFYFLPEYQTLVLNVDDGNFELMYKIPIAKTSTVIICVKCDFIQSNQIVPIIQSIDLKSKHEKTVGYINTIKNTGYGLCCDFNDHDRIKRIFVLSSILKRPTTIKYSYYANIVDSLLFGVTDYQPIEDVNFHKKERKYYRNYWGHDLMYKIKKDRIHCINEGLNDYYDGLSS